ncbi:serine/threonine protein kinase [bacterium]|nr:serine/threonine protein kinase [bacterium]
MNLFARFFGGSKKIKRVRENIAKRFDILGSVGNGSMSKVHRAMDRKLGREVCLKILDKKQHLALVSRFPGMERPEEGEVAVSLTHPNLVATFDWGWTLQEEPFLVMEMIKGTGLNFFADTEGKSPLNRRLDFLLQAADGLSYFHQQGYIHRDISPKNIMVTDHGIAKIIDFGLCVPNKPAFRRPGNRTGTLRYMAPELIRRSSTDERIDVFSFGVTAYEVLTGSIPWEGAGESMQEALQHVNVTGRDPREVNPHLDATAAEILLKGIARDPNERYRSMREFADALKLLEPKVVRTSPTKLAPAESPPGQPAKKGVTKSKSARPPSG